MIWNFSTMKQRPFEIFLKFARKSLLLLKFCQMREVLKHQFCWYFWNVLFWFILIEMKVPQECGFQIMGCFEYAIPFFRSLIYSVFHETFVKKFMKLSFFSSNFKNTFQDMVYYRKLGCLTLWYWNEYKVKSWKICLYLGLFFQK